MAGIFEELFSYRPREGSTPAENFLTQAFAHVLRKDRSACEGFLALALGEASVTLADSWSIETQLSRGGDDAEGGIPDMQVRATLDDDRQILLVCEHKWDAQIDPRQLTRYARTLQRDERDARLVLIANSRELPKGSPPIGRGFISLTWSDVHGRLSSVQARKGSLLPDLLQFLDSEGMGTEKAVSTARLAAFTFAAPVIEECHSAASKLVGMDWANVPASFRTEPPAVKEQWGRLGIQFNVKWDKTWLAPGLFLGFLVDAADHDVAFVNEARGFDLMLTIDRDPGKELDERGISRALKRVKAANPAAAVAGPAELRNHHRVLMIRRPAADVLMGAETLDAQACVLHEHLSGWCSDLFEGGEVERALRAKYPRWKEG